IVPEILKIDEEKIESFLNEKPELKEYKKTLDEIARQRAHILSEKEEVLLSEASEALSTPSQTFGMLNNADCLGRRGQCFRRFRQEDFFFFASIVHAFPNIRHAQQRGLEIPENQR